MYFRKLCDAQNPYTDFVTLREMANHPSSKIRSALVANRNLQTYLHPQFAEDRNEKVRLALTENPNLSREAWEILQKDKSEAVRASLKKQWSEPPEKRNPVTNKKRRPSWLLSSFYRFRFPLGSPSGTLE